MAYAENLGLHYYVGFLQIWSHYVHVCELSIKYYVDWMILDEHFCNCLPDDYQSTLVKLKKLPQLSNDDHQQLRTMISSSCEAQLVNEKIVTFLVVKLCFNGSSDSLVGLREDLVVSDKSASAIQQGRYGTHVYTVQYAFMLFYFTWVWI